MIGSRYEDAMHWQARLLDWWKSADGKNFGRDYAASMEWSPRLRPMLQVLQMGALQQADPIYVSPDVTEIVDHARRSFNPEVVLPTDPFTLAGFAYFPRPIMFEDRQGRSSAIRAALWCPLQVKEFDGEKGVQLDHGWTDLTADAMHLSLYSDWRDEDDFGVLREGALELQARGAHLPYAELLLCHAGFIPFNDTSLIRDVEYLDGWEDDPRCQQAATGRELWTFIQTFWRLGNQVLRESTVVPRSYRRNAQRRGLPPEVTVIKLRRYKEKMQPDPDAEPVDWDHRWLVRGHWRNQWYPSIEMHRQVWINPYVKGPEDKPLVVTKRAFEFVR